jgi:hypothetical protein
MKKNEIIKELESIESMLNEDNPNISDIRTDVALLLTDLTSEDNDFIGVEISYNDIEINGC